MKLWGRADSRGAGSLFRRDGRGGRSLFLWHPRLPETAQERNEHVQGHGSDVHRSARSVSNRCRGEARGELKGRERLRWCNSIHPIDGPPRALSRFLDDCIPAPILRMEAHHLTAVNLTRIGATPLPHLVNHNYGRFTQGYLRPDRDIRIALRLPSGSTVRRAAHFSPDLTPEVGWS